MEMDGWIRCWVEAIDFLLCFIPMDTGGIMLIHSHVNRGFSGDFITIEVDLRKGFPGFDIVGLPDSAIRESRERVRVALRNSGFGFPRERVLINLAPADIRKEGSQLDLAIALAIVLSHDSLGKDGQSVQANKDGSLMVVGELGLEGSIHPLKNIHNALAMAESHGCQLAILPDQEISQLGTLRIARVASLVEAVKVAREFFSAGPFLSDITEDNSPVESVSTDPFKHVVGLRSVRRAMEIAAAGNHNLLLFGPPGAGKTMMASRFAHLLVPPVASIEQEILRIHAWCSDGEVMVNQRPIRMVPHDSSWDSLLGGTKEMLPGEAALAHGGVMVLDEIVSFKPTFLEGVREICDRGEAVGRRTGRLISYPARFQIVATMNPCPCGALGRSGGVCGCSRTDLSRYWNRIGVGLLDRIDLRVPVEAEDLSQETGIGVAMEDKPSQRIDRAVWRQRERYAGVGFTDMRNADVVRYPQIPREGMDTDALTMVSRLGEGRLTGRALLSVYSVARTIADLADCGEIEEQHVIEALGLRRYGVMDFYWKDF